MSFKQIQVEIFSGRLTIREDFAISSILCILTLLLFAVFYLRLQSLCFIVTISLFDALDIRENDRH